MFRYIKLADLLKEVVERGRQLKSVIYENKQLKPAEIPSTYSLLSLVVNNIAQLKLAVEDIAQKSKTSISNIYLALVMLGEFINTGKIVGGGKLKRVLTDYHHLLPPIAHSKINKRTVQIRLRAARCPEQLRQRVTVVGTKDSIVSDLYHLQQLDYSTLTRDTQLGLLQSSGCVMQSLSSALPPFLLMRGVADRWPEKKVKVIDACSAPGNKTLQLAEALGDRGRVYAFEKDQRRYQLLKRTLKKYGPTCIRPTCADFLQTEPIGRLKGVKFILLDPSCSGSGMLTNFTRDASQIGEGTQTSQQSFEDFCDRRFSLLEEKQKERVESLHKFQLQLLTHAATFRPRRLSYSTCSIYRRENEDVVTAFLASHPHYRIKNYRLKGSKSLVAGFGPLCKSCLRMDPRLMETDGFFVTIFTLGAA